VRLEVGPAEATVIPRSPVAVVAQVFNTEDVINAYEVRVFGVDPAWVELERDRLSLFPSSAGVVTVLVHVPEDYPAGELRLGIEVIPVVDRDARQLGEVIIRVPARTVATLSVDPVALLAGRTGRFNLTLTNEGNAPVVLDLSSTDPEAKVTAAFSPPTVELVPGEQIVVPARTTARPPLLGSPTPRSLTFQALGADAPAEAMASFIQKPIISRSLLSMFGLLAAVTVFALVLTTTLNRIVVAAKVDPAVLKRAVEGAPDDRGIPSNPGTAAGRVALLTSGAGVPGVTVELFASDDASAPVASAATGDDGSYELGNLAAGAYKARFRGAGFVELWWPSAQTFEEAGELKVKLGQTTPGIDIAIGGQPGSIAGTVVADDPAGATVTLQVPAAVLGSAEDAELQVVTTAADGSFLLENVPAPSSYVLVVSKERYTTAKRVVNLAAAEEHTGVEIRLGRGDGLVTGLITDVAGEPLGGVAVTASNTVDEVSTISLTTASVGSFSLRDLPTPSTYTISFVRDGYATENLTVTLGPAERLDGMNVTMIDGTGSVGGEVRLDGGGPVGGVTVTVSNTEVTLTTESLSVGDVGSYLLTGLPVPGTYTVTFSGAGLASQVRSVNLGLGAAANARNVSATLKAATAVISGTVRSPSGPAPGVAVELSDGTTILQVRTADDPPGAYVLAGVPPGTYTLTFRQTGAVPRSVLLTLAAGEARTVDVTLDPQASISGTVRRVSGTSTAPLPGAQVLVYLVDQFPQVVAATALTGGDGTYRITDLAAPEEYIVEFAYPAGALPQSSTRVVLDAGEQKTGIDATLTLAGDG